MNKYNINRKKKRRIDAIIKNKKKEILVNYFFSPSFFYMVIFASMHYFFDKNSIFLSTFGVVIIDIVASFIYYIMYLQQVWRDEINIYYENKKKNKPFMVPLINKSIGEYETIAAFKIILFLILSIFVCIYYVIFGYILKSIEFMSASNAFEYAMFLISIAYFDVFWEGGVKKINYNFKRIRCLTKEDKIYKKIFFYILLFAVAMYQLYTFISDINFALKFL